MNIYLHGIMSVKGRHNVPVYFRHYSTTGKSFYRTTKSKKWHKITVAEAVNNGLTICNIGSPTISTILKNTAKCRKCNTILESRLRHGFVSCKCGSIFIDGGNEYWRAGGNMPDFERIYEIRDLPKGKYTGTHPSFYMKVY